MKVIFLDCDGVLNCREHWDSCARLMGSYSLYPVYQPAVRRLRRIIAATGAYVVISSTWRLGKDIGELRELLGEHGLDPTRIIGKTGRHSSGIRGLEIADWIERNGPVESFIILDDDSDMAHLQDHLVKTTFDYGLTEAHVEQAIALLTARKE